MLKKIFTISTVLIASTSVASAYHRSYPHNYKVDYKAEAPAPCPTYQFQAGPYLGLSVGPRNNFTGTPTAYYGIEGTISAGYGAMLSPNWYLAGEILGGDSAQINDYEYAAVAPKVGVKTSWSYGASLIPGYMITDHVLGYIRAGGVRSRFEDQGTQATAWQVGLGGQTSFYRNWDVRGEYVYSKYGSVSGIGKPQASQFNLGIVYKFV